MKKVCGVLLSFGKRGIAKLKKTQLRNFFLSAIPQPIC
jgi:hypothetical protein